MFLIWAMQRNIWSSNNVMQINVKWFLVINTNFFAPAAECSICLVQEVGSDLIKEWSLWHMSQWHWLRGACLQILALIMLCRQLHLHSTLTLFSMIHEDSDSEWRCDEGNFYQWKWGLAIFIFRGGQCQASERTIEMLADAVMESNSKNCLLQHSTIFNLQLY